MSKKDYIQFNGQLYETDIKLVNEELELRIPSGMIKDLVITDSIYSPFSHAVLSINSTGNNIDNLVIDKLDEIRHNITKHWYAFNTDSKDMFYITIVPKSTAGTEADSEVWGFNYNTELAQPFVIYDEEEILDNRGQIKTKVFYLKQLTEQLLEDANIQWSTANVVAANYANKINLSHVANDLRKAHTGDSIKHLIEYSIPKFVPFSEDWDKGGTKVFHTSGPQTNSFDDLEKLLDKHVAAGTDDFCIFGEERNGNLFLRSMTDIYKKAYREDMSQLGDFFVDAFSTHCGTMDTASVSQEVTRTVPSKVYGFTEKESNELEGLVNFSYLNMANVDSMKDIVTTIVHAYDHGSKQFNIDSKDNHIFNIKKRAHKLYSGKMKSKDVTTILPLNMSKVLNETTNHVIAGGGTKQDRMYAGVNRVMRQLFAFAPTISFDTKGASSRRSGRFIIMNANYANTDSPFAKVFIGEWLTSKVVHYFSFSQNQYLNTVTCVKPHSNDRLTVTDIDEVVDTLYTSIIQESDARTEAN